MQYTPSDKKRSRSHAATRSSSRSRRLGRIAAPHRQPSSSQSSSPRMVWLCLAVASAASLWLPFVSESARGLSPLYGAGAGDQVHELLATSPGVSLLGSGTDDRDTSKKSESRDYNNALRKASAAREAAERAASLYDAGDQALKLFMNSARASFLGSGTADRHTGNRPPGQRFESSSRFPTDESQDHYNALRKASVAREAIERKSRDGSGDGKKSTSLPPQVLYIACCGLGHRLMRQAASFHGARGLGARHLWIKWGTVCASKGTPKASRIDLFELLFGSGPMVAIETAANVTEGVRAAATDLSLERSAEAERGAVATNHTNESIERKNNRDPEKNNITKLSSFLHTEFHRVEKGLRTKETLRFNNGAPGYEYRCPKKTREMVMDKARSDHEFYKQLRSLFRYNYKISRFVQEQRFSERITFGVHVRTGNGEKGDFKNKNRGIGEDLDEFLANLAKTLYELGRNMKSAVGGKHLTDNSRTQALPPLVFIATDDASVVARMAKVLAPYGIATKAFPQLRLEANEGVTYVTDFGSSRACIANWASQFIDASLLGATDALIAARYSSFTQSLPLATVLSESIVRGGAQHRKTGSDRFANRLFCEVNRFGDGMKCYDDFGDWAMDENQILFPADLPSWNATEIAQESTWVPHRKEFLVPCP